MTPWHCVPVLARKPGAVRNGAPFKDWGLRAAMERVRRKLANAHDGKRTPINEALINEIATDGSSSSSATPCWSAGCTGNPAKREAVSLAGLGLYPGPRSAAREASLGSTTIAARTL